MIHKIIQIFSELFEDEKTGSFKQTCLCGSSDGNALDRGLRSRARFERDETRLELISRIGGTGTRLIFSGLVTRENSGKIRE